MYDIEWIRYDLIEFLGGGVCIYPALAEEIEQIRVASDEDVIRVAISYGIDVEDYRIKDRSR